MDISLDLLLNALVAGLLLGGFYAAVTIGVSISFGILDIVNIAHPAFIILGSYIAYMLNSRLGSLPGTLIGAMLVGIVESLTSTFYGPSWAPAVAFGFLLLTLALRPVGLFGR